MRRLHASFLAVLLATLAVCAVPRGAAAQTNIPLSQRSPVICPPGSSTPKPTYSVSAGQWVCTTNKHVVTTVTGIQEATATDVFKVTVPAAFNGSAIISVTMMGSLGAGGSVNPFESAKSLFEIVTVTRTAGTTAVVTVSTAVTAAEAHVASGCTAVLTSDASSVSGSTGGADTFTIRATISNVACLANNHRLIGIADLVGSDPSISIAPSNGLLTVQ